MTTHLKSFISLSIIIVVGLVLFSCSSTNEASENSEDSYGFFDPAKTVVIGGQSTAATPLEKTSKSEQAALRGDDTLTETILGQFQELKNVLDQLKLAGLKTNRGNGIVDDLERSVSDLSVRRAASSDREIIELLKEQNTRLVELLEQLKTIVVRQDVTANERSQRHKALQSSIDAKLNYSRAIRLYEQRRFADAIVAFQRIQKGAADDDRTDNCRFWVGVSYFNLRNYKEAIPEFKHLLAHQWFEKREATYIMLGQCYEQSGQRSLAKATYQKLVQLNPVCDLAYVAHLKISML